MTEFRVFVPGRLRNPLNGRRGWRAVWATSKELRERTFTKIVCFYSDTWLDHAALEAMRAAGPKRVCFTAHVGAEWDDDNLRAAIKPHRDALKDAGIIDDDRPSAGHVFEYAQRIDRRNPGVEIVVTLRDDGASASERPQGRRPLGAGRGAGPRTGEPGGRAPMRRRSYRWGAEHLVREQGAPRGARRTRG